MIRNWRPYTLGALFRNTGCTPLEPALQYLLDYMIFGISVFIYLQG
jgi:hypothetical protein